MTENTMGIFNSSLIDTKAGDNIDCPFCPEKGWEGDSDDYMKLMRKRFRSQLHYQRMVVSAAIYKKKHVTFTFTGPFKDEAKKILQSL